jgi:hypothetical protein
VQPKTTAGLLLIVLAAGIFCCWSWWVRTRSLVPVSIPIPLAANQSITSAFKLNFDSLYLIEIEARKAIPLDELHCLMGLEADAHRCGSMPPVIAATWVLAGEEQNVARGSSLERYSAPTEADNMVRVIGEFQGRAGKNYELTVTFGKAADALAAARPKLRVEAASIARTDLQSASVLVLSTVIICVLFGVILLSVAYFTRSASASRPAHRE